jgi:hypothetical protein
MTVLISNVKTIESDNYDLFICSYGYESRSVEIAKSFEINAIRKLALGFDFGHVLAHSSAQDFYVRANWELFELSEDEFEDFIEKTLKEAKPSSLLIDISCFSRLRIAKIICAIHCFSEMYSVEIIVDIAYSVASYTPPSIDFPPITNVGPIIPALAGWPSDPSKPISCLIGLGYDEGRAIGAAEYLEAAQLWLFRPIGFDNRFLASLNRANQSLIEKTGSNQVIDYRLDDPVSAYMQMHSLIWGLKSEARPLLLPFGPKIFAAIACAAAINFYPDVSVWRVSSGQLESPVDRTASGRTALARFTCKPS